MSLIYCHEHDRQIDLDYDAEHFEDEMHTLDKNGDCKHANTELQLREVIFHPDDPMGDSQWREEYCFDCKEIVGEIKA